jgi:hypothetical protein
MDITIDTSALIAIIVGDPEREKIIELTSGNTLSSPFDVPTIKATITTQEIVEIVRYGRES